MHTNKLELVSSQAVGLAVSVGGEKNKSMAAGFSREIPLTSHRYQQTATANKHFAGFFLPAAGNRWEGEFYNVGSNGNYWSSTPYDSDNAYYLYFGWSYTNWNGASWYFNWSRDNELSVRPVR